MNESAICPAHVTGDYDPDYADDGYELVSAADEEGVNVNNSSLSRLEVRNSRSGSRTPRVSLYSYRNSAASPSPDRLTPSLPPSKKMSM